MGGIPKNWHYAMIGRTAYIIQLLGAALPHRRYGEATQYPTTPHLSHPENLGSLVSNTSPSYQTHMSLILTYSLSHPGMSTLTKRPLDLQLTQQRRTITGIERKIDKKHNEFIPNYITDDKHLIIYSDGSLRDENGFRKVGAGWVGYHLSHEVFHGEANLGSNNEVCDAELLGLSEALKGASMFARTHNLHHIHALLDNQAVIRAISESPPFSSQHVSLQIKNDIYYYLNHDTANHLNISRVPGHNNILGNERADTLAKVATNLPPLGNTTTFFAFERRLSQNTLLQEWTKQWRNTIKENRYQPQDIRSPDSMPRRSCGGHALIGEYYSTFVPAEDPSCPCHEPIQTREHIIASCPNSETE